MGGGAVHIALRKHPASGSIVGQALFDAKLGCLLLRKLLSSKLVAGEKENLELLTKCVVQPRLVAPHREATFIASAGFPAMDFRSNVLPSIRVWTPRSKIERGMIRKAPEEKSGSGKVEDWARRRRDLQNLHSSTIALHNDFFHARGDEASYSKITRDVYLLLTHVKPSLLHISRDEILCAHVASHDSPGEPSTHGIILTSARDKRGPSLPLALVVTRCVTRKRGFQLPPRPLL